MRAQRPTIFGKIPDNGLIFVFLVVINTARQNKTSSDGELGALTEHVVHFNRTIDADDFADDISVRADIDRRQNGIGRAQVDANAQIVVFFAVDNHDKFASFF